MIKKLVLVATLALCLTVITAIVAVAPTLASPDSNTLVNFYYSEGTVTLHLPPNGTKHPVDVAIGAVHGTRRSTFGAFDLLGISLWIPQAEAYIPVAVISDNAQHLEFSKTFWNGTPVWRPPYLQGTVVVDDKDLDIWTESTRMNKGFGHNCDWNVESGDTFIVNLTKPVYISLPFNSQPSGGSKLWGNLSFTLPPLTLVFREIGDSYYIEDSGGPSFSGITYVTKGWQTPAWVEVEIPSWIHVGHLTEVGSKGNHLTDQFTLPS